MAKVLVVEDEAVLRDTLRYNLQREGYAVVTAANGEEALTVARKERPDLVLLDIMLPKMSGFDVCRTLRRESTVPILMLTARDDEVDKVVGLELGADDYVTKPFGMRELMARVGAHLRRVQFDRAEQASGGTEPPLVSGDLVIDTAARSVRRGETLLTLKPKEFDLLTFFVRHRGQVLTRDLLLERVWGYDFAGDTRTVDVHVRWLREKIEAEPSHPTRIQTVRNVGYRFEG